MAVSSFDARRNNAAVTFIGKKFDANQATAFLCGQVVNSVQSVSLFGQVTAKAREVGDEILLARLQLFTKCKRNAKVRFMHILNIIGGKKSGQLGS